jgi:hypothetical protein
MKNGRNKVIMALAGVAAARAVSARRRRHKPALGPADARRLAGSDPRRSTVGSHLSQVHFGESGATKDRRKRSMARVGIVALVLSLLGAPGINLGLDLLQDRLGHERPKVTSADLGGTTTSEAAESLMRIRGNLFQSRPTPTPTPTEEPEPEPEAAPAEPAPPAGSVSEILYAAAAEFGIDGSYLVSVASCESGLSPGAVNPAGYHGLFQFDSSTWAAYGYGSVYDPVAQARTAARMLAAGMASRWPNCA